MQFACAIIRTVRWHGRPLTLGGMPMVTWMELLTFCLVLIAVIDLTMHCRK